MILIDPDLIHPVVCEELINIFEKNRHIQQSYNGSIIMNLTNIEGNDFITAKKAATIIERSLSQTFGLVFIEYAQFVFWRPGAGMDLHYDTGRSSTELVSITNLNDNYAGGETYIKQENITIVPKTGKTIAFDGMKYMHQVNDVISNCRYTLIMWYTRDISQAITTDFNL
jgi:predicted 2-oxoglutarate/Fe(II)-dependent dioxygenase YbiX